ncbi:hypothetical protein N8456_01375 [Porticoccaceae bacterium]|nr:hypothetical protein [Porticoccaceae bacterium]
MASLLGLITALAVLILLTMRGVKLLVAAPVSAFVVAVTSAIPVFPGQLGNDVSFISSYMSGFSGFVTSWFFMFLLGSIFGKLMEDSGSAESISRWLMEKLGKCHARLAVVATCAVLMRNHVSG